MLIGQDIADYGGVFKVTDGFLDEFGPARVRNTPIIESGALGAALGLALDGFRPMVEMQFGDFISTGFNQMINNLATTHYRWGGAVPVVIRAPIGGGLGAGPFHSQNVEAFFCHVPGLRVVAPATPADAKGLLLAAFDDGNPVLFLEHKALYRTARGPVPAGHDVVPLGEARSPGPAPTPRSSPTGRRWLGAGRRRGGGRDGVGRRGRGDRPALARCRGTARPCSSRSAHVPGARGPRGAADRRLRRRGGGDGRRRGVRLARRPGQAGGGLDTPVPFAKSLEADWSPPAASSRPSGTCWPSELPGRGQPAGRRSGGSTPAVAVLVLAA